jgi:hypothetical protein
MDVLVAVGFVLIGWVAGMATAFVWGYRVEKKKRRMKESDQDSERNPPLGGSVLSPAWDVTQIEEVLSDLGRPVLFRAKNAVLLSTHPLSLFGFSHYLFRTPSGTFVKLVRGLSNTHSAYIVTKAEATDIYLSMPNHCVSYEEAFDETLEEV